jgi:23S rRNA (pseudouridine1915-N3)-methyltransferase
LAPKGGKRLNPDLIKQQEASLIEGQIKATDTLLLLDERGKMHTSREFAGFLESQLNQAAGDLCFVLGGAYGFDDRIYARADMKISLSTLTFPHQLARIVFTEQLYRACTILNNESYHHD